MRALKQRQSKSMQLWLSLAIAMLLCLTGCASMTFVNQQANAATLQASTPETLSRFCGFSEPLLPLNGEPSAAEKADLMTALSAYRAVFQEDPDQVGSLEQFLKNYPKSTYRASINLYLGQVFHNTGHYSKALTAYRTIWADSKAATEPKLKALTDRALGELVITEAYLGHYEELEPLLKEGKARHMGGTSSELLLSASEGLYKMNHEPGIAFRCGPMALTRISQNQKGKYSPKTLEVLNAAQSTRKGTNLAQVQKLSVQAGMNYQMAFRTPGAEIVVPAVTHWKVGHFAGLLDKVGSRYRVEDATFGANGERVKISAATLDEEATGYFLIPSGPLPKGWRSVSLAEGEKVWGRGNTGNNKNTMATGAGDPGPSTCGTAGGSSSGGGPGGPGGGPGAAAGGGFGTGTEPMTSWSVHLMLVSLKLTDTPVGYSPGAFTVPFSLNYAQRDALQPANFSYTNFGPKWTCNFIAIITDNIAGSGRADLYAPGGGGNTFNFSSGSTSEPELMTQSTLTKVVTGPTPSFVQNFPDGSVVKYGLAVGNQYFMTERSDAQGNKVQIQYDAQQRIASIIDPAGRAMTLEYGQTGDPLKVTKVTDPFGRFASFSYTADGHLASMTDILGITSSYQYGPGDFINTLTTPYGSTHFSYGDNTTDPNLGTTRFLTATDPAGRTSRAEYKDVAPGIPFSDNAAPAGISIGNNNLFWRNTFFWEPQQLASGPLDYTKATQYHFVHGPGRVATDRVLESVKKPLLNRVWFTYPGAPSAIDIGTSDQPNGIGQVLSDGTSQNRFYDYNAQGNVISSTDPMGRVFSYSYAPNGIDLTSVSTSGKTLFSASYDNKHNILTLTDASGSTSSYTYNARGQMLTATNSLGETTTYTYSDNGNLLSIAEPLGRTTTFAYDSAERLASATDSEGYTVTANYDSADRPISVTYPDGTSDIITYNLLDTASTTDRLGRKTSMAYDSLRRLVQVTDPNGGNVGLDYGIEDSPTTLTDQGGRQTQFAYDLQQRLVSKQYAGGATQSITYQNCCGRLRRITDALGHTKTFDYYLDNTLKSITYSGTTPAINFTTDPFLPRPLTMTDGQGTTNYSYVPVGSPGANGLESVTGPLGDQASFQYDAANRMTGRMVNGSAESQIFDPLWRTTSTTNPLDTFNMTYLGKTGQVTGVTSASGPTSQFTYHPNTNDRRLAQIKNLGRVSGTGMSQFDFTQDTMGQITKLVETHGSVTTGGGGDDDDCHKKCCHGNKCCKKDKCCKKKCCKGKGKCGKDNCKSHHHAGGKGHDDDDDDHHHSLVFPFTGQSLQIACLLGILFASAWMMIQIVRDRSKARPIFARVTSLLLLGTVFLNGCLGSAPPTTTTSTSTQDFSYDKLGQLIGISVNSTPSASFQFDPSGNLVSLTSGETTSAFTYNSLNQPTTPAGTTFDAKGQTTASGGKTFEWDDEGRLTAIVNGSARSEFGYDGYGRRISITEKSGTTITSKKLYWWLGGSIVCERDGLAAGNPITKRYFGQGVLVGAQKLFYTFDQLGSVRELVDDTGAIRADYRYDTYGTRTKSSGDLDSDFGYAGLFHHAPSGLLLATHRAFDPVSHRWLSRDPLGEGVDLNLYRYCGNNPTNFSDPDGLDPDSSGTIDFGGGYQVNINPGNNGRATTTNRAPAAANVGQTSVGAQSTIQTLTDILLLMLPIPKQSYVISNASRANKCAKGVKVTKAVNSGMAHAAGRAAERGVFANPKDASAALRAVSDGISRTGQFPAGAVWDTAYANRVLVPVGDTGYAVYSVAKNGAAKLETVIIRGVYGK